MGMESKIVVLALDSVYRDIGRKSVGEAMVALSFKPGEKPVWLALDIGYALKEDGTPDTKNVEMFRPVNLDEWTELPVRDYDLSINTAKGPIRVPGVIISQNFADTVFREVKFSNQNVLRRDGFRCQYKNCPYCGNKVLEGDKLNIDHILPRSRGGENTWDNTVASCIEVNTFKNDRTPEEAGLELVRQPFKPSPELMTGKASDIMGHIDWAMFLK